MSSRAGVAGATASSDVATPPRGAVAEEAGPSTGVGSVRGWRPTRAAVVALLLGLVVTAALALTSLALYNRNESRLLGLRARELALVLTAVVPSIQTPLASAAELADATHGDPKK